MNLRLVVFIIGLFFVLILAGCGGKLNQEKLTNTSPMDSIMKNISLNPETYFKTFKTQSLLLLVKDAQGNPIENAYVLVHEQGATDILFKSLTDLSGEVSGNLMVLSGNNPLVAEVDADGYEVVTEIISTDVSQNIITMNPVLTLSAISAASEGKNQDTDHDGVADKHDDSPHDSAVAFHVRFPAFFLAYEDLYPGTSDWDVNDLVVKMELTAKSDKHYKLKKIEGRATLMARGADAAFKSDFHLNLGFGHMAVPGVASVNIYNPSNVNVSKNMITFNDRSLDMALFVNTGGLFSTENVSLINTLSDTPYYKGSHADFTIVFDKPFKMNVESKCFPPFDPYILVNNPSTKRRYDIHLPFRDSIDGSLNPTVYPYNIFIDDNKFPYCMIVPETYAWPLERIRISSAYPDFILWVQSGFKGHPRWFNKPDTGKVYTKHLP